MTCCAKQPHMQQLSKSACGLRAAKHRPASLPSYHNNCSPVYGTSSQQIHCFDRTTIPAMHAACKKTHVSMQLVVTQHIWSVPFIYHRPCRFDLGWCSDLADNAMLETVRQISAASAGRQSSAVVSYNKLGFKPSLH